MNNNPIGIYDSGAGGLTVWHEIIKKLPNESTVYLSDSKNAPYGDKPINALTALNFKNVEYLIKLNCKIIVVACNTATTHTVKLLRKQFNIPIVGIEPAVKPAAKVSRTGIIGVLATENTLQSPMYQETIKIHTKGKKMIEQAGHGLVRCIENGLMEDESCLELLNNYLQPMLSQKIDTLVLGCTHYPFLKKQIQKIIGSDVELIDSGLAIAKRVAFLLEESDAQSNPLKGEKRHHIITNGDMDVIKSLLPHYEAVNIEKKDF